MSKERWAGIVAGIAVVALCVWVWVRAPKSIEYETIEIPLPEGFVPSFSDWLMNDAGVVVGAITTKTRANQSDHLFLWDRDGGSKDLGNPRFVSGQSWINLVDINNKGQLIGDYGVYIPPPSVTIESCGGFFYDQQMGFRAIGGLKGFRNPSASAINDRGQVVGECKRINPDGETESRIILWDPDSGTRDPNLAGWAKDINNFGHILGVNHKCNFIWSPTEGKYSLKPFPYQTIFHGFLDDSDQITGLFRNRQDSDTNMRVFCWNHTQGYYSVVRPGNQLDDDTTLSFEMKEQRILIYYENTRFDWFGLVDRSEDDYQIRLYTVGKGEMIAKGIPRMENPQTARWGINRNGWIVCTVDQKAYLMIPKGKAGRKKD